MLRKRNIFQTRWSIQRALFSIVSFSFILFLIFVLYTNKSSTQRTSNLVNVRHIDQALLKINDDVDQVRQPAEDAKLMTCQLHGRIGNMMFAYASLVGIAVRNARTPALPTGHFLRSLFRLRAADIPHNVATRDTLTEQRAGEYDDRVEWINSDAFLVQLVGYFQSWKYFSRVDDEIRREFAFSAGLSNDADKFLSSSVVDKFGTGIGVDDVILVGIHVRVRDMASIGNSAQGYTVATPSYLSAAIDYFTKKYTKERLLFVLATDDVAWCDEHFPFPTETPLVRTGRGPDALDLAILSSCNHMIITVGTFGWWAAWLADGTTIYYKDFLRPNSSLAHQYRLTDYYPSGWIAM